MSHISQFFHRYLPDFYLDLVDNQLSSPSFLLQNTPNNIYRLTTDLILSSQNCIQHTNTSPSISPLAQYWHINYHNLRNSLLPTEQNDNKIILLMKSELKYVHVQMIQILVRLLLCYHESFNTKEINNTIETNIQEIGYIYPALKIEVSLMHPDINLTDWFDTILHQISQQGHLNHTFKLTLNKISESCGFIGPLQRVFLRHSQPDKGSLSQKQTTIKQVKITTNDPLLQRSSNLLKDTASQRQSSMSCDKKSEFDDFQLFRNKKKKIIKERFRINPTEAVFRTPIREKPISHPTSPITEKTAPLVTHSDTTENNASSFLYQKMKKSSKILERTLYYGQTKRFMPKRGHFTDPEQFIQSITASSFKDSSQLTEESMKKVQRKLSRLSSEPAECSSSFLVPETPKPSMYRTGSSNILRNPPSFRL